MKSAYIFIFLSAFNLFSAVRSDDLVVGTTVGGQIVYLENVELNAIWLNTRTKNVFYSSERNQIIRGISAIDLKKSGAKPTITAGGIGSSFVNVRIKSEQGVGLKYQVQIFA